MVFDYLQFTTQGTSSSNLSTEETPSIGRGNTGSSYKDIAWLTEALQNSSNNTTNPQENSNFDWMELAGTMLSMGLQVVGGLLNSAQKDVESSEKKIKDANDKSEKIGDKVESEVNKIINIADDNMLKLIDAIDYITELQDGELADLLNKLAEIRDRIESDLETLNDPNASEEDKDCALEDLKECNTSVDELLASVGEIKEKICEKQEDTEKIEETITDSEDEAEVIIENGNDELNATLNNVTPEEAANTGFIAQGEGEEVTGDALLTEAATWSSNPYTSTYANQLREQGTEYKNAGNEHKNGGTENITKLVGTVANISLELAGVFEYSNAIGAMQEETEGICMQLNENYDGIIEATGSWDIVNDGNEALANYINERESGNEDSDANNPEDIVAQFELEV